MGKFDSVFSEIDSFSAPKSSGPLVRSNYYKPTLPAEAEPEQQDSLTWGDYGNATMMGGAQVGGGIGNMAKALGFEDAGQFIQDASMRAADYWAERLSPYAKEQMAKEFIQETPDGYAMGDAGWDTVKLAMAQSALGTAAGGGLGGAITKGLQLIPKLAPTIAGMLGYGAGESIIAAGSSGAQVEADIDKLTHEQMADNPAYQAALAESDGDQAKAKQMVKDAAAGDARALTGISTFLLSAPFGATVGKFTAGLPLASTRPRSILSGAAGEAGQEFLQSGAEQLSQNYAVKENADSSRTMSGGVLNNALGGAFAGGAMGGAMGVLSPLEQPAASNPTPDPVPAPATTATETPQPVAEPVLPKPSTKTPNFNYEGRKLTDLVADQINKVSTPPIKGPAQLLAEARAKAANEGKDPLEQARAGAEALAGAMASFRSPVIPNPFNDNRGSATPDPIQQRTADTVFERETAPKTGEFIPANQPSTNTMPARSFARGMPGAISQDIEGQVERPALTNQNIIYGEGPTVAGLLPSKIRKGLDGMPLVSNRSDGVGTETQPSNMKAEIARLKQLASKKVSVGRIARKGSQTKAWTPDNKEIDLQFEVVESSNLQKSNDNAGAVNKAYPAELQPRDRTSLQSRAQITEIAGKLNPNRLGDNPEVTNGAPIVDPDTLAVIAGNGRSLALDRAYSMGDKAGYKQWLVNNAAKFGINAEEVAKMKNPVLVRNLMTPMTAAEKVDMAGRANERTTLAMTPTETAQQDAQRITDEVLAEIKDGDLSLQSNVPFIRKMAQSFGTTEAAGLMDTKGRANKQMIDRLTAAIVAKAYGSKGLTETVAEGVTEGRKNLVNALVELSSRFARLQRTGRYSAISGHISEAVDMLRDADSRGLSIDEYLAQQDSFSDRSEAGQVLAVFFDQFKNSKPAIVEGLESVYSELQAADDYQSSGSDMFGDYTPPTVNQIVKRKLKDEIEAARARGRNGRSDTRGTGEGQPGRSQSRSAENGSNQAGQGSPQAEAGSPEDFGLSIYSEEDIAAKEKAQQDAADAEAARIKQEEDRAKADQARDDFALTGSNQTADIAAAAGQEDIFSQPEVNENKKYTNIESEAKSEDSGYDGNSRTVQAGRKGKRADDAAEAAQFDLFAPPIPVEQSTRQTLANYFALVESKETGQLKIGVDSAKTPEDAAHIFSRLISRKAQEHMAALILDENYKPIELVHHSIGMRDSAQVDLIVLLGSVLANKKARHIWISHNHPSGIAEPSQADQNLTALVKNRLNGTDIQLLGHVIVTAGQASVFSQPDYFSDYTISPTAKDDATSLTVTERSISKQSDRPRIKSVQDAIDEVKKLERDAGLENGIILFNAQLVPVGVVELTPSEMKQLRQGRSGGAARIMEAAHATNAGRFILRLKNTDKEAATNIIRFSDGQLQIFDVIEGPNYESLANRGELPISDGKPYARLDQGSLNRKSLDIGAVSKIVDDLNAKMPNAEVIAVARERDLPQEIRDWAEENDYMGKGSLIAVYHDGKAYVVAENSHTEQQVIESVLHEVIGHHGIQGVLGDRMDSVLDQIARDYGRDGLATKDGERITDIYGLKWSNPRDRRIAAEEYIAHLAETNSNPGLLDRIIAKVRELLRQVYPSLKWTDADIAGLLAKSRKFVEGWKAGRIGEDQAGIAAQLKGDNGPGSPIYEAARAKGLDMSKAARMERAKAMGFDTGEILYHGTPKDFNEFDTGRINDRYKYSIGFHFSTARWDANAYTRKGIGEGGAKVIEGASVIPVYLKYSNPLVFNTDHAAASIEADLNRDRIIKILDEAKAAGNPYDSVVITRTNLKPEDKEWDHKNIIVFEPNQIRSIHAAFDPDQADSPDIRAKLSSQPRARLRKKTSAFEVPVEDNKAEFIRKIADKFKVLKDLQANIEKAGGTVSEDANVYRAETLMHGKAENDLNEMRDTFVEPLAKKMAQYKIGQALLDEYLRAKHAKERNAHIAKINPAMPDGGSGMTNKQAQDILDSVAQSGRQAQFDELADIVYAMLKTKRDMIRQYGLEDDEVIDAWEASYKNYVPLKGFAEDEKQEGLPRTGKGFSVGGSESKRAAGRSSESASPLSYAIQDLTETLLRKRKNDVGNTLLNLVEANPEPNYWEVFTNDNPEKQRRVVKRVDPATGQKVDVVEWVNIPMAMMQDRYFTTKRDGQTFYIRLDDQRLMKAMKNLGPDTSNFLIQGLGKVSRFLASVNTSYNPEFLVSNFARDIQTAILNINAEQSRDDGKAKGLAIAKQVVKDVPKAMKAAYRGLRNSATNKLSAADKEWFDWFDEFKRAGAKTGYYDMKDIDGQAKDIQRLVDMANGGFKGNFYKWSSAAMRFVDDANGAVENAVRLSAYVNARKAGVSQDKAADLAKNLTVNFNRRGEVGTTLNAVYMFANASIQGTANFVRTMGKLNGKKGDKLWSRMNMAQKIAVGMMAGAYGLAILNRMGADDDDDGENFYDKIPQYVKERNIVIMKSLFGGASDEYWKIPLPYGYNIFHNIGTSLEAVTVGGKPVMENATNLALATLGSFSPIGFQESQTGEGLILKNVAPTIMKPVVELALNENFAGQSIYNENFPFGTPKPDSSLGRRTTPAGYKQIAEFLNDVSGGSQWRSGAIDINPDVMRYLVDYATGGAGAFALSKVPDNFYNLAVDVDNDWSRVAFVSKVAGKVTPYADQEKFYQRRDEINQIITESKELKGRDRIEFIRDNRKKMALGSLIKSTETKLKLLRRNRDAVYNSDLSPKAKDLKLKEIEARMKAVVDQFNAAYAKASWH